MMPKEALECFGLVAFRPPQDAIVDAVLEGRDVQVLMPTGGGKSLTYQLPAMCRPGFTVVISPLISLMQNQVQALHALGIGAVALTSDSEIGDAERTLSDLCSGDSNVRLVYVAPESAMKPRFLQHLRACHAAGRLQRFAVDECHCIVQWGHDFRPEYATLGLLRQQMPGVPIIALTASASPEMLGGIATMLRLREPAVFKASFNRPNLRYGIVPKTKSVVTDMFEQIKHLNALASSGIIYCFKTGDCEKVAEELTEIWQRDNLANRGKPYAAPYHAKMDSAVRAETQRRWMSGAIRVVVATIAFGMGIDKPDVRFVLHHTMSKSLEGYYQESGRAGRDGALADCVLYYSGSDYHLLNFVTKNTDATNRDREARGFQPITEEATAKSLEALSAMREYAQSQSCRRAAQMAHFGETFNPARCGEAGAPCDFCRGKGQRPVTHYFRGSGKK